MKRVGKEPRLLPNVMEAIASLKEKQGSTQKQIVEHIVHILKRIKEKPRNVTMQIRRALDHGMHSGLIKQRSGKYTLGLDKRDYAIFRRFRQINDPGSDCNSCRRGRRRGRRGKRSRRRRSRRRGRRGRKRAVSAGDEVTEDSDSAPSIGGTPEPMDRRGRRRRRRGRRGHRRGRRGRKRTVPHGENSDSLESDHKESSAAVPLEKRRSDQDKQVSDYQSKNSSNHNHHQERTHMERNHLDRSHSHEDEDVDCGNPECLCNIKQEDDSPRCMSRENNYFNDSYLN